MGVFRGGRTIVLKDVEFTSMLVSATPLTGSESQVGT